MSYVVINERQSDTEWRVRASQYERLQHEWARWLHDRMTHEQLTFTTIDGVDVTILTELVGSIAFLSDEALQAITERRRRERQEDAL